MRILAAALAALAAQAAFVAPTFKATAADLPLYQEASGVCAEAWVQKRIIKRFAYQVKHVPQLPLVDIVAFANIREVRYEPATGEEFPIGRSYCAADVALSDGRTKDIWYLIEEGQGFASIGDNVEFCVAGFDRWNVYNGRCRILR